MSGLASVFPPPPPYYEAYTETASQQIKEWLEAEHPEGEEPPESIKELLPPALPENENYRGFGEIWTMNESLLSLNDAGVTKLYGDLGDNDQNLPVELKKLLKSALVSFVTLVGAVAQNPESFPPLVENLRTILINMHHLLNVYRPHQSREALSILLKKQIAEEEARVVELNESNNLMSQKMKNLVARIPDASSTIADLPEQEFGQWLQHDLQATELWIQRRKFTLSDVMEESRENSSHPTAVASDDEPMEQE